MSDEMTVEKARKIILKESQYQIWDAVSEAEGYLERDRQLRPLVEELIGDLKKCRSVIEKMGIQFGCGAKHSGVGSKECPRKPHHHHDEACVKPWLSIEKARSMGFGK